MIHALHRRLRPILRPRRRPHARRVALEALEARSLLSTVTIDFEGFPTGSFSSGREDSFDITNTGGGQGVVLDFLNINPPLSNQRLVSNGIPSTQTEYTLQENNATFFQFQSVDLGYGGSADTGLEARFEGFLGATSQGVDIFQPETGPATFTTSNLAGKSLSRLVITLTAGSDGSSAQLDNIVLEDQPDFAVIDDGDPGFTTVGPWSLSGLGGFEGDSRFVFGGTAADTAEWAFTVIPGQAYRVYATYPAHPTSSTRAAYNILDGATIVSTEALNQRVAPDDLTIFGAGWEQVGPAVTPTGGTLTVRLTGDGVDGSVRADGVMIVATNAPAPANPIDDGDERFATVGVWQPSGLGGFQGDSVFYPAGGTAAQTASWRFAVTPGTRYAVFATYPANSTSAVDAPFSILDGATVVGGERINQRSAPNDLSADGAMWEKIGDDVIPTGNTMTVRLAADANGGVVRADAVRLEVVDPLQIVDNGDADFATVGNGWLVSALGGFQGDSLFNQTDTATQSATWTFTVLPGEWYRVYTTYPAHPTSSTQASFSVLAGTTLLATDTIDQRVAPNDIAADGANWELIGDRFFMTGTSLTVRLDGNGVDGAARADAVRIEVTSPPSAETVIDDGDPGFTTTVPGTDPGGAWLPSSLGGFLGDSLFYNGTQVGGTASWTFSVTPGQTYNVYATWPAHPNSGLTVPYQLLDGGTQIGADFENQRIAPSQLFADGVYWNQIGTGAFTPTSSTLTLVVIVANSGGVTRADAARIELVGSPSSPVADAPAPDQVDTVIASPTPMPSVISPRLARALSSLRPELVDRFLGNDPGTDLASRLAGRLGLGNLNASTPIHAGFEGVWDILATRRRNRLSR